MVSLVLVTPVLGTLVKTTIAFRKPIASGCSHCTNIKMLRLSLLITARIMPQGRSPFKTHKKGIQPKLSFVNAKCQSYFETFLS
jgi:hypothetical protein